MLSTAISDELDADFKQIEGLEAGTLKLRRHNNGTYAETSVTIDNALRLDVERPYQPLETRGVESSSLAFVLLAAEADPNADTPPQAGDLYVDAAGVEYSVRTVRRVALNTRFRLTCSQGRD